MFGSSGFGSTPSTFGASTFGATANTGGSVFGQPAQQQQTASLFGGGGTAFGTQQATLPAFGAGATTASAGAFGAQPNTSSVFGQQARPTTGIFSSTATTISPFSAQTQVAGTSIPFNAITGTDTMMKNGAASQINTRHQCITCMKEYENKSLEELRLEDYQLNRKGPSSSMFGAGATAAPQAQPGGGLFSGIGGAPGAVTQGTSTFGQTSAFGQTAPTAGGGLFSSLNQPKPGGFFGNTATSTSTGFGGGSSLGFSFNNPTSQPQASIFGQNNNTLATSNTGLGNTSAFSFSAQPQQQQQQGLSLFGQKPLTTPASSAPTFGGGFGSTATNTALNKPLFGAGGTTTFGAVSAAPTFGAGTGSLFSTNTQPQQAKPFTFSTPFSSTQATSQPTFGNTSTSTFSFSNPVSTPAVNFGTGTAPTFGSNTGTTGAFGAPLSFSLGSNTQQQPQAGTTGSTFGTGFFSSGNTNPATGGTGTGLSLFGSGGGAGTMGTGFGFGFGAGGLNMQQTQQLQQQQQQQQSAQGAITFATTPFKDNQLFYNLISNRKIEDMTKPTNPLAQRQYREASRRKTSTGAGPTTSSSTFNISMSPAVKNLTFASSTKNSSITKFKIFDGFEDDDYGVGVDVLSPKTNVKKLVIKNPDIICSSPSSGSGNGENGSIGMARRSSILGIGSPATSNRASLQSPLAQNRRNRLSLNYSGYVSPESGGNYGEPNRTIGDFGDSINEGAGPSSMLANQSLNHSGSSDGGDGYINGGGLNGAVNLSKRGSEIDVGSGGDSFLNGGVGRNSGGCGNAGSVCGVICTRPQYYLKPSLEDLDRMVDSNGACMVSGLEIGRVNFGRIKYLMPVNVANINIDDIVHFRHKEVTVYPDDKNKPELGNGLNSPAEIELERVWPVDKASNELIRSPDEIQKLDYEAKLRKACTRTGSEFISYNREQGVWKFKVPHFSKYSCDVEEDEEEGAAGGAQQGLPPKGLGGISQQKLQQQRASMSLAAGGAVMAGQGGPQVGGGDAMVLARMSLPAHYSGVMPPPPPPPALQHQQHLMEGGHPPPSDVELNPLTPCDSDDEDDDDLDDDDGDDDLDEHDLVIRRPSVRMSSQPTLPQQGHPASLPKYKPILEDCGTEKSRLMKSVMSISEYGDGDPTSMSIIDSQPPTKKSRPPMMMSLMASETEFPEEGQRLKKRLSMMQGPGSSSVSAAQAPALKAPAPTIRPVEPTQFSEEPMNDLFSSLRPSEITSALRLQGCARVCFLPNGHFLTVSQSTTPKTGQFNGQVKLNQLLSYADKQEIAPLSASYRVVLEKQMQDRLDKEGVLFQEHLLAIRNELRGINVSQVKKLLESELAIWELCDILWPGELDIEPDFLEDDGFLLHQRERLGEWLKKNASLLFGDGYDGKDTSVLGFMKKGLVEGASGAAIQEGNLWLAVVLASSPHQHLEFEDEQEEIFEGMPKDTSDVFALVSGNLRKLSWLDADKVRGMTTHEWLQHFALHIWYEGPVKSLLPVSVDQAVREFEEMMREIAQDEECPLPATETSTTANLAMHLLKLYSCTGYPMNIVLTPRTWTDDCLDYKLDWLLMMSLEDIGYSPGDDLYKAVCLGYTGMLEGINMWKWCKFVMSHLPGPECEAGEDPELEEEERLAQESFSERLLERNIGEGMNKEENFLVYKLGVSEMLLYSIKGWKSLLRKRADETMWYAGMMGDWQESYGVLTSYLESSLTLDLIGKRVPSQAKNIQKHLARLEANQSRIAGWEIQGKMLTNYLKMLFEQGGVDATEAAVICFMESVIKFKPVNTYQCAFLLDMALSAQKVIQLLLAEPEITAERRARIEDNLVQFLEINVPKEYFDGLRCFINFSMMNNTAPFRVLEYMERDDIDDEEEQAILMRS